MLSQIVICSTSLPLVVFINGAGNVEKLFSYTSCENFLWYNAEVGLEI